MFEIEICADGPALADPESASIMGTRKIIRCREDFIFCYALVLLYVAMGAAITDADPAHTLATTTTAPLFTTFRFSLPIFVSVVVAMAATMMSLPAAAAATTTARHYLSSSPASAQGVVGTYARRGTCARRRGACAALLRPSLLA